MPETPILDPSFGLLADESPNAYPDIPEHLLVALRRYAREHVSVGGFLTAVLENDLVKAAGNADPNNRPHIADLALWCWNALPGGCYGSPAKVKAWLSPDAVEAAAIQRGRKIADGINWQAEDPRR